MQRRRQLAIPLQWVAVWVVSNRFDSVARGARRLRARRWAGRSLRARGSRQGDARARRSRHGVEPRQLCPLDWRRRGGAEHVRADAARSRRCELVRPAARSRRCIARGQHCWSCKRHSRCGTDDLHSAELAMLPWMPSAGKSVTHPIRIYAGDHMCIAETTIMCVASRQSRSGVSL